MELEAFGGSIENALLNTLSEFSIFIMLHNIYGKRQVSITTAILPEPLKCGLIECVINYVMVLVNALLKSWIGSRKSKNTDELTKPILRQVRDYLKTHINHIQYRQFKKQGLPIGSGMVESACKWLIQQRFKGTGMRWSEDGFNHLLHLRLAWVNRRFDALFSEESLELTLYSPNR